MTDEPLIVALFDLTTAQMQAAGGKGRALAQLAQAGFPVPAGFVILSSAFAGETLTAVAWAQLEARLRAWRRRQPDATFAIRSSGSGEDSGQAAFAGHFATRLNVATDEAVREAIHVVYASRASLQAATYRRERHLDAEQEMAIIVQELIPADCAGVCSSVDPVSLQRDRIVVNAAWGLGAAVMEGTITADTAWVCRHDFSLEKQRIVPKPLQLLAAAGGGIRPAEVPAARQRAACLPPSWLRRVAQFGLAAELLFGHPQEIEWAVSGQQLWILQSRPITTLPLELAGTPPFPVAWADEVEPRAFWTLADYSRGLAPPVPLEHDTMAVRESIREETCRFLGLERNQMTRIWNGRAYVAPVPTGLSAADRRVRQAAHRDLQQRLQRQGLTTWDYWGPEVVNAVERLRAFDVDTAAASETATALADHLEDVLAVVRRNSFLHPGLSFKPGPAYFQAFAALTGLSGDQAETAAYRLLDSEDNMLTRLVDGLYRLAQSARQDPAVAALMVRPLPDVIARLGALPQAAPFLARLDRFLAEFGERIGEGYGSEMTVLTPTWREEPARLLHLISAYFDPVRESPARLRARARDGREMEVEALCAGHADQTAVAEFRGQLAYARRCLTVLEDHNHWIEQVSGGLLRRAIMAASQWLLQAGMLAARQDVFWLTFAEIAGGLKAETAGSLAETVAARRAQHTQWATFIAPPILGVPPAQLPSRPPLSGEVIDEVAMANGRLQGVGASPGQVTGRARIIIDSDSVPVLATGDVLVAPNAGPLWTPLFPALTGLVLESGSLGQHAAVTAREYGLPAVIGCPQATQQIPDEAIVQLDGQTGVVTILNVA
jgi:rifampicin phosphotransferase